MMKIATIALAAVVLGGCATAGKYKRSVDSWIGAREVDLVRKWGPPHQTYDSGGSRFLGYSSQRNVIVPGVAPTYTTQMYGNTAFTTSSGGVPPSSFTASCMTTFEVKDEVIVAATFKGSDCKSR